ncbi:unnamed protein product [Moneuplotes crassus]|uniref:Uncharacterized protein n=1 Tax=Euplotes crassus TaxID=5936 RepID=A0AAD1XMX5_EUPCR|nr:unnamed protein product [Moneuplotes crassus]
MQNIADELKMKKELMNTTDMDGSLYGYRIDYEGNVYIQMRCGMNTIFKTKYSKFINLTLYDSEEQGFDIEPPNDKFHKRRHKKQDRFSNLPNITELRITAERSSFDFKYSDLGLGVSKMVSKITKELTFHYIEFSSKSLSLLFTSIVSLKNLNLVKCTLGIEKLRLPNERKIGLNSMTISQCFFAQEEGDMTMEDLETLLKFLAKPQFGKLRHLNLHGHHFGFFELKQAVIKNLGLTSRLKVDSQKVKVQSNHKYGCVIF